MSILTYHQTLRTILRAVIITGFSASIFSACGSKEEEKPVDNNPVADAEQAALYYYNALLAGNYDTFADGILSVDLGSGYGKADSLPEAYRRELADAAGQFAVKETKKHGGIASVQVLNTTMEADSTNALVNLDLAFGDSTHEEILLSMQKVKGNWKMK